MSNQKSKNVKTSNAIGIIALIIAIIVIVSCSNTFAWTEDTTAIIMRIVFIVFVIFIVFNNNEKAKSWLLKILHKHKADEPESAYTQTNIEDTAGNESPVSSSAETTATASAFNDYTSPADVHGTPQAYHYTNINEPKSAYTQKSNENDTTGSESPVSPSAETATTTSTFNDYTLPADVYGTPQAYHYTNINVCIIRGQEPDYSLLRIHDEITFAKEPTNVYDSNAVAVFDKARNIKVGYLYKGSLQDMVNDFISGGHPIRSRITDITPEGKIQIEVAFYRRPAAPVKNFKSQVTFALSSSTKEAQENISDCADEGDDLEFEFDYDTEKFAFYCNTAFVGYAPSKYADILRLIEDNSIEYSATVDTIDESDSGRFKVTVSLKY